MELLGGLLIGGLGSYISSKVNSRSNERVNNINVGEQNRINDLNYQRQLEFWNMTNAYNSPKAQMQRYREAGINPHLVAGGNAGLASSPTYRAEAGQARAPDNPGSPYAHMFNLLGQLFIDEYKKNDKLVDTLERELKNDHLRLQNDLLMREIAAYDSKVPKSRPPVARSNPSDGPFKANARKFYHFWNDHITPFFDKFSSSKYFDYGAKTAIRYGVRSLF